MDCKLCNESLSFDKTCILICCLKLTAAVHLTCIYDRGQRSDIALSHSLSFSPVSMSPVEISAECKFFYVHIFNSFHVLLILSYRCRFNCYVWRAIRPNWRVGIYERISFDVVECQYEITNWKHHFFIRFGNSDFPFA